MGALKSQRCKKGHKLTARNVYYKKNGQRECRQCSFRRATDKATAIALANRVRRADEADYRAAIAREILQRKRPGVLAQKRLTTLAKAEARAFVKERKCLKRT